ncbi:MULTISPECIES: nucleotide sugar dehydrogenase [Haloferax]|uniref:nucleotide sugar dehydrogenase n=1 Tax=Haloferax TaxID=2251 RepID=UPI000E23333A|nr:MULTISPECIES: nucleotide sugar dehydrogenase [Haloferax]RDZ35267.1 nucleotide sugar dehydrogenase [Haloferax sp. Atlit-24N]RLM35678.1 nucleotide sugar dehydrogenase [Haloferax sp. Atlit-109R]RLM43526.1 nucleotide sugar dehydrogenase [Haloferax sp. Atlit-105R]WEL26796.1 UDP-N-acetyl-D-mannosaminuronate dehydrogenase [Haloferax lucentense]
MTDICVHGLGYIGLPTAAMFANSGYEVVGYDIDSSVVRSLQNGNVHFEEPGLDQFVNKTRHSGNLVVATDVEPAKTHIICVPTPFDAEKKKANLDYVMEAGETIKDHIREGDLVILESTVPPETTEQVLQPILEQSGLGAGEDFGLAHCPETVLPGNMIQELRKNARIVGGITDHSTERASHLYSSFVESDIYKASNPSTAEFAKLIQNTFRDTNIALANEIAVIAHGYGIDSRESIRLANEHPRVNIHHPGPGVGGHCLPVDPWFLGQNSDDLNIISKAREINDGMTEYIIKSLQERIGSLSGKKVSILGVAYKGNVGDTRQSPGLKLARELQSIQSDSDSLSSTNRPSVEIKIHDPYVSDQTLNINPLDVSIRKADVCVVTTDHDEFKELDPERFNSLMSGNVIVDTKAVLDQKRWENHGFDMIRI